MGKNLSDVTVKLNVEQPSVPVNMGNLAIFVKGESPKMESFGSYDDVVSNYSENDAINQLLVVILHKLTMGINYL